MKQQAYIFDIDGTLADCWHRLHFIMGENKDWDAFYSACVDDNRILSTIKIARALMFEGCEIIKLTGRPETYRALTSRWLRMKGISDRELYMRDTGDHRPDYEVKREIYERYIKDKYEILGVFEDRQQCVDMWRSLGLTCFQVAKGDY